MNDDQNFYKNIYLEKLKSTDEKAHFGYDKIFFNRTFRVSLFASKLNHFYFETSS